MKQAKTFQSIDEYIKDFPQEIQLLLQTVRNIVKEVAPNAEEAIKYGIPTFILNGNLVHFAAFKKHLGFYPTPSGTEAFKEQLAKYRSGKGSIQFPLDQPLPVTLIRKIVEYRVNESQHV